MVEEAGRKRVQISEHWPKTRRCEARGVFGERQHERRNLARDVTSERRVAVAGEASRVEMRAEDRESGVHRSVVGVMVVVIVVVAVVMMVRGRDCGGIGVMQHLRDFRAWMKACAVCGCVHAMRRVGIIRT